MGVLLRSLPFKSTKTHFQGSEGRQNCTSDVSKDYLLITRSQIIKGVRCHGRVVHSFVAICSFLLVEYVGIDAEKLN